MNDKNEPQGSSLEALSDSLRAQAQKLGLTPGPFRDESLAPQVDLHVLQALVRRKLSQEDARLAHLLIASFRSWSEAYSRLLVEAFPGQEASEPETES